MVSLPVIVEGSTVVWGRMGTVNNGWVVDVVVDVGASAAVVPGSVVVTWGRVVVETTVLAEQAATVKSQVRSRMRPPNPRLRAAAPICPKSYHILAVADRTQVVGPFCHGHLIISPMEAKEVGAMASEVARCARNDD
jgi:hypothetical protein